MAASVVDLPLPVGPVTSVRPLGFSTSDRQISGMPSSSSVGTTEEIESKGECDRAALQRSVRPKAAHPLGAVGEVELLRLVEGRLLLRRRYLAQGFPHVFRRQHRQVLGLELTVDAQDGRKARLHVQVRGARLHHTAQQAVHVQCTAIPGYHRRISSP